MFLTACGQNAPRSNQSKNQTAATIVNQNATPPSNQAEAIPANSTALDKLRIKTSEGIGKVTKINLELGSVGLDHDEIKGIMPAMEGMEFYVSDKKMLDGLKVGDKVDFVLEDNAGVEQIIKITKE